MKLKCGDEDDDVIDEVVCIFKETVFKLNCSSEGGATDTRVDAVVALLLQLLDETDGTARAVAMLIGEYCAMYELYGICTTLAIVEIYILPRSLINYSVQGQR